jgi:hypothetical protein
VRRLDGLDFTPEMLARAGAKGVYDRLIQADVLETGLPAASYDLLLEVLADEQLAELWPLYRGGRAAHGRRASSSSSAIIRTSS